MPSMPAKCPYCRTIRNVTPNMSYKCLGCGATITIGGNGHIKSTKPNPKK